MKDEKLIKEDLEAEFKADDNYYRPDEIEIRSFEDRHNGKPRKGLIVSITSMYQKPQIKRYDGNMLKFLNAVQKCIGYDNLDIYEEVSNGGCETCDYGSKYGWEFIVWDD